MPGFGRVEPPADVGVARWLNPTEGVSKQMATISIERNSAVKSIVVRFCANAFIKNRQNRKLRRWFCVFTHPRPLAAARHCLLLGFGVIVNAREHRTPS